VGNVLRFYKQRLEQTQDDEEKKYLVPIRPQMTATAQYIDDLQQLFFGENIQKRDKRQLFLGLAMALGVINAGCQSTTHTK
jgi:hypothetical protein